MDSKPDILQETRNKQTCSCSMVRGCSKLTMNKRSFQDRVFGAVLLYFLSISSYRVIEGHPVTNMTNTGSGTFWQITDIHWDEHYSQKGDPDKMCHLLINETKIYNNGKYGSFVCDSPWMLVKSAVQAMKHFEPNPDFIIWTGDNAPHLWNPSPDFKDISHILSNVTRHIASNFPNSTILPVIGNHDTFPPDTVPPENNSFYNAYLTSGKWNEVLPSSAWDTFIGGGYYIADLQPGLKLIGLNTILWFGVNKLTANLTDPGNQFSWLESSLEAAKNSNEKVYIIGHVPPGQPDRGIPNKINPSTYHEAFNNRYISVINRFGDVIAGQFFAHYHYDTFGLFRDKGKQKSSMLLAPSVTPWHKEDPKRKGLYVAPNPSVRLYHYDRTSGRILNYEQYFLNLTKANSENTSELKESEDHGNDTSTETNQTKWEFLYSFVDTYNKTDVSTDSLFNLSTQLLKSAATFDIFYNFTTVAKYNGPCDNFCHKLHMCAIVFIDHNDYARCMKPNVIEETVTVANVSADLRTFAAHVVVTEIPDKENHPSSGSSRNILIGCTLSLLVIVMILVVVYIKRTRLAKGPRFVRFQ